MKIEDIRTILCGAYQENSYLVCPEGREDAFLIDPGDDLAALQKAIEESGRKLAAILLTHGHFDHILAAQPLSEKYDATVFIHAQDAEMLDDPIKSEYRAEVSRLAPPNEMDYAIYDRTLTVCGEPLQVLSTPGHTKGSVCLYQTGTLFCGDTLFRAGYGRTDLHGGSETEMVRSLKRLFTLPGDTVCLCGHGPSTTIADERRRYGL